MPRSRFSGRSTSHHNWNPQTSVAPVLATSVTADVAVQERVDSLLRERLDLHAQLFDAAQIQRKLSGPRALQQGSMQFASEVFAAHYLSGDFVVLSHEGPKVLTAVGDIAGKGFAAGMWFTNLAGLLQSYVHPSDPGRTAAEINRHLCYLRPVAPFVTAFFAQLDCEDGTLIYCNAGHFPPILLHSDGRTETLDKGGPLLGALEHATFDSGQVSLTAGDILVAYSDGVLECRNSAGEEFGMLRLLRAVHTAKQPTAQETLVVLLAAIQDFANGRSLSDDLSLLVIQRNFTH